ncbi:MULTISPECIES: hypothetical protein [Anaerolinea]|uniref:hypothetical protein n=1 Tax=Anaerolinea TaxID=233189 RepID=UPI002633FD4E|nr:hypothetical protein [Anaerolinea thermophila]
MQEIVPQVYIETAYPGVTLGAINSPHGLILIDAPFRPEDARSWRSALISLSGGVDRLLINLDAHFDRTIGVRNMECTVLAHERMAEVFRNRPMTFKAQGTETGAEWEQHNGLGSVRWSPPEITFSDQLTIHWDDHPIRLEYRPGCSTGAIWAVLPASRVIFLGDAVVLHQPPFLASANLPLWIEQLESLLQGEYQDYLLVSGRGGLVAHQQVRAQIHFLRTVQEKLDALAKQNAPASETETLVPALLEPFNPLPLYRQRLRYGLAHYYARHYQSKGEEVEE